jgi:hypothetical protein
MPANNRIYYASQAVLLQPQNSDATQVYADWLAPQGLQSVGMTTNFTLQQVFQLGQLDLYDNFENVPDVQVTINKVIDGTPPLYLIAMNGGENFPYASDKELPEIVNNRVNFRLGIYSDSVTAATGDATHHVDCSGMYLSAFTYTFPVEGNATEEITLVGNNKVWGSGDAFTMNEFGDTTPDAQRRAPNAPSTVRRMNVNIQESSLPLATGNDNKANRGAIPVPSGRTSVQRPYLQNISVSANLGRDSILELGAMAPYFRYVNFPLEITSEFQVVASDGDKIDAKDFSDVSGCGKDYTNLAYQPVKIVICGSGIGDKLTLDLGTKNKLTSVNYTGGDTGGGNATITYSYQTFNKFKMKAEGTFGETKWIDNSTDTDNWL